MRRKAGGRAGRIVVVVTASVAAWLCAAPAAPAAVGDIAFESCIADDGLSGCTDPPADALLSATGVAVSPDGNSVYVTGYGDSSITHFTRGAGGGLTFESCISDSGAVPGCTDPDTDSISQPLSVAVSPDGNSVYVASEGDDSITHFTRGAGGELTFESCIADAGGSTCTDPVVDSLNGANAVTVSPDGNSVYVTSNSADSITHFTRAPGGSLTFESCIADGGAVPGCTDPPIDSLNAPRDVRVSADGSSAYVAAYSDDAITHLTRAPGGALTFESCIAEGGAEGCADPPTDSLDGPRGVAISPDDASVYVTTFDDDSITHFTRGAGGGLAFESCIAEAGLSGCADPPIDSLDGNRGVAVSPDGASAYVTSNTDDSITHFNRDAGGALTFAACIAEAGLSGCADPPIDSLNGGFGVTVSPDGGSVYTTAASPDHAITHFTRETPPPPPPATPAGPCANVILGTSKSEKLTGTAGSDLIRGQGGNDKIRGGDGDDCLRGGRGRDRIRGGKGDDQIHVRRGRADKVRCGPGKDTVIAGKNDKTRGCEKVKD